MDKKSWSTLLQHHPKVELPPGNRPLVEPIYLATKYTFERFEDVISLLTGQGDGFMYGRHGNPTVMQLERLLANLQGCEGAIATASGIAALNSCFLSLLKSGDHAIVFYQTYMPTRTLFRKLFRKFGVHVSVVSLLDHDAIEQAIRPGQTRLMVFESPTNPQLAIADLQFLCELARKHGIISILDNTFSGFHNHSEYPVDLYVHSLTKFATGHGDALGGIVLGRDELIKGIRHDAADLGAILDPQAAYLILRGLKTYSLRYEKQCANAMELASWLEELPQVRKVRYPGLPSHPQHHLAARQQKDFGSVISFDLDPSNVVNFLNGLELTAVTGSLGATESLIAPVMLFYGRDLTNAEQAIADMNQGSLRLSVGLEDVSDVKADILAALGSCSG